MFFICRLSLSKNPWLNVTSVSRKLLKKRSQDARFVIHLLNLFIVSFGLNTFSSEFLYLSFYCNCSIKFYIIFIFSQLYGEEDPDQDVSPDTEDPEAAGDAGQRALGSASSNGQVILLLVIKKNFNESIVMVNILIAGKCRTY